MNTANTWPTQGLRLEFGTLACTAGLPLAGPCACPLCALEDLGSPVENVTQITQGSFALADTLSNTAAMSHARETKMANFKMFNQSANDGAALYVALRVIPVALVLAAIFQALVA